MRRVVFETKTKLQDRPPETSLDMLLYLNLDSEQSSRKPENSQQALKHRQIVYELNKQ